MPFESDLPAPPDANPNKQTDRILAGCGYLFVGMAVVAFGAIVYMKVTQSFASVPIPKAQSFADFLQTESATIILLIVGYVTASMGRRLLSSIRYTDTRTIPVEDLPLIREAVVKGIPEPIDQYLRLRSLSGIAGNFTKLQVTGLPLTTVFLTLVFAGVALIPLTDEKLPGQFLDLAKLTLGAFIGSFVQGRVEQRKQQQAEAAGKPSSSMPPA
jgi:hypothetical protein